MSTGDTMILNFVNKYGVMGLNKIIELFKKRVSNEQIAKEFGVTRQRVHQWQREFTRVQITPTDAVRRTLYGQNLT